MLLAAGVIAIALVSRWVNSVPVDLGQLLLGLFVLVPLGARLGFRLDNGPRRCQAVLVPCHVLGAMGPMVMAVLLEQPGVAMKSLRPRYGDGTAIRREGDCLCLDRIRMDRLFACVGRDVAQPLPWAT